MATTFVNAIVVLPPDTGGTPLTTLRFDRSRIMALDEPPHRDDTVIDLEGRMLYPGLINAHDHLELNHFPRSKFRDVYGNAQQWSLDFQPRLDQEPYASLRREPLDQRCRVGGLKNLHSGVTMVAHHNPLHKPLRRRDFPVRVVQRYGWAHSLYLEPDVAKSYRQTRSAWPWMIHVAEGTDSAAAEELSQLAAFGCLQANTVLIHGVSLSAEDRGRVLEAGAGLVWCPSSNFYLLGQTAQVAELAQAHRLALGTDSRLTADGDMLDEIKAAYATRQLTPEQLFCAVTNDAASLLRLEYTGALLPGYLPDFLIVAPADQPDPYQRLMTLKREDINAVYIGGVLRYDGSGSIAQS